MNTRQKPYQCTVFQPSRCIGVCLGQWYSICRSQPFWKSHIRYSAYQIFMLGFTTIAKLQLLCSNDSNFKVGSPPNMRNCINKAAVLGRLKSDGLGRTGGPCRRFPGCAFPESSDPGSEAHCSVSALAWRKSQVVIAGKAICRCCDRCPAEPGSSQDPVYAPLPHFLVSLPPRRLELGQWSRVSWAQPLCAMPAGSFSQEPSVSSHSLGNLPRGWVG